MSCLKVNNIYNINIILVQYNIILNKNTRIYRKHRSACIRYTPMSIYIKQLSFMQDQLYNLFLYFSFLYIFVDGVHLNARGTLLYWKKHEICSEKIWSEMKKYNLSSRALRNCGAARSAATAGHLTPPQSS